MIDKLAWRENRAAIGGWLIGPLLAFVVFLLLPDSYITIEGEQTELPQAARVTAAVAILMAVWWMTEAISVYATALLPLALFPLFNVSGIHATAIAYGNGIIYLFLGGFILALALERWGTCAQGASRVARYDAG